jgi:hypothetical protein
MKNYNVLPIRAGINSVFQKLLLGLMMETFALLACPIRNTIEADHTHALWEGVM